VYRSRLYENEDFNVQDHLEKNIVVEIDQEENKCSFQDHREISIGDEDMEILQSDKDENWHVQDNLEKNIADGSNQEEKKLQRE
jgi:hypothetical protein